MVLGDAGAAATVALRIEGAPAAGTELCLASEGELPERGCAGALLGHSLGIASTAQGDLAQTRLFTVRDGARVDVRVIVRRPEGALELDVPGLAVGARHVITLGD